MHNKSLPYLFCLTLLISGFCANSLLIGSAHAGIVSKQEFLNYKARSSNAPGKHKRRSAKMKIALDLSGYRDAAVEFDFASLMRRASDGFSVRTATDIEFLDDFHLMQPQRRSTNRRRSERRRRSSGFVRDGSSRRFSSAMFNLADYDGQSVVLSLQFNHRLARRRGYVDISNLRVAVDAVAPTPSAAAIPEPNLLALLGGAGVSLLIVGGLNRRRRERAALAV